MFSRFFGFGFGAAFGLAAWRTVPPMEGPATAGTVLLVLVALLIAFRAGRWRRPLTAIANAEAHANAVAASRQVVHVNLGDRRRPSLYEPDDQDVAEVVQLYGVDAAELVEQVADELDVDPDTDYAEWLAGELMAAERAEVQRNSDQLR